MKVNSYKTEFTESHHHGVENQSSINVLGETVVFIVVFMLFILMLACLKKEKKPNSRQDVANNDLLYNQDRANRPQPTLIDMEPTAPSGSLIVPVRSTNIQVQVSHGGLELDGG